MMFLHRWLNPHCPDCREEREDSKHCISCDNLKLQNALLNDQVRLLISRLTDKPEPIPETGPPSIDMKSISKKSMPWGVRRQMLEDESRVRANAMRGAAKPDSPVVTTEELEKELGVVETEREGTNNV